MKLAVFGKSVLTAQTRHFPEDFVVSEIPSFDASGEGEHYLLTIRKTGLTTHDAVQQIAKWARIAPMGVGYAGIKDKHGVTEQRFSVHLPKKQAPSLDTLQSEQLQILDANWHSRKLPRGASLGNAFVITLRDVVGEIGAIEERLKLIGQSGFPNIFGEQRFGRGDNVAQAIAMFRGRRVERNLRSILLSAARSEIFNRVVAARYARNLYDQLENGDVLMLDGSRSVFGPIDVDEVLLDRFAVRDVVPTGPLWGQGELRTTGEIARLEREVVEMDEELSELAKGLVKAGLNQERRALIARAGNLQWLWLEKGVLRLHFDLAPGAYATAMMDQLGDVIDVKRVPGA